MVHQHNCHTSTGTDNSCHGAGEDRSKSRNNREAPPRIGITHSISPNVPCPETILVVFMTNGSYLLVGYPQDNGTWQQSHRHKAGPVMIRKDRALLAELARLNSAMASLALCIMDGSASPAEQRDYAQRLIAADKQLAITQNITSEAGIHAYHIPISTGTW